MDKLMKMQMESTWSIERYTPEKKDVWNRFIESSRNGTFLFDRGYMDYHSDRYIDCSWMAYKGGKLRGVLPANITEDGVVHSHQGLSYGGWITSKGHVTGAHMLSIFEAAISEWRKMGIRKLDYKRVPDIYASMPAEEDVYALYRLGAVMTGCGLSTTINLREDIKFNEQMRRHLAKASRIEWHIEEDETEGFMHLLTECLESRHQVRPVHSLEELRMLKERFSTNIRIFTLRAGREGGNGEIMSGVCVYDTGRVAHTQYIATSPRGRDLNMLTPLFHRLIMDVFAERDYFDFGISTEDNGAVLNEGLLRQKSGYGGGGVVYPRYELEL